MKSLLNHTVSMLQWQQIPVPLDFGDVPVQAFQHLLSGLRVIESGPEEFGEKRWYHVSFSFPNITPSYDDLDLVRRTFIGIKCESFQIFPRSEEYINIHPHTLHLYHCLDGELFPDSPYVGGA